MSRSPVSCHPTSRGAWSAATAGALLTALALVSCGSPDASPSPSPTPPPSVTATASPAVPYPAESSTTPEPTPSPTPPDASPSPEPTTTKPTPTTTEPTPTTTKPTPTTTKPTPTTTKPTPTTTSAVPSQPADLVALWAGLDIEAFDTGRRVVALTFDGGASADAVQPILATLRSTGVPATFFATGEFARRFPAEVRAIAKDGHPVGNHSDTHPYFTETTDAEIRAELAAAEASISALTGRTTEPLFRFPFGDRTAYDITVVNRAGYIPIRWTVDTLGWKGTSGGITVEIVRQRVLDGLRPGGIVLMHVGANPNDGSTLDADALPGIIKALRDRGYGFATVPDLLDDRA